MGWAGYGVTVKAGVRFKAPRADGTAIWWTVKRGIGGGTWTAQPDGDEKGRVPFHDSEIIYRIQADDERAGSRENEQSKRALGWLEAQPVGTVLHVKVPSGLPSWERTIFLRGVVTDLAGRRLFKPTGVIAKPEQFEAAMTLPWFAKRIREQMRIHMIPSLFECFEAEAREAAYDPTGMEEIPAERIGGDPETERLEKLCALAVKTLRQKATAKKRLTPLEAVKLAHAILGQGLKAA